MLKIGLVPYHAMLGEKNCQNGGIMHPFHINILDTNESITATICRLRYESDHLIPTFDVNSTGRHLPV
jgi:hypothetical protein